jgi:hypothetical protein
VRPTRVIANLSVPDIGEARTFYADYLGLSVEGLTQLDWVAYEIVHPLTTEPWGLRRFLVRAPDGNVINVNSHKDE